MELLHAFFGIPCNVFFDFSLLVLLFQKQETLGRDKAENMGSTFYTVTSFTHAYLIISIFKLKPGSTTKQHNYCEGQILCKKILTEIELMFTKFTIFCGFYNTSKSLPVKYTVCFSLLTKNPALLQTQ